MDLFLLGISRLYVIKTAMLYIFIHPLYNFWTELILSFISDRILKYIKIDICQLAIIETATFCRYLLVRVACQDC